MAKLRLACCIRAGSRLSHVPLPDGQGELAKPCGLPAPSIDCDILLFSSVGAEDGCIYVATLGLTNAEECGCPKE